MSGGFEHRHASGWQIMGVDWCGLVWLGVAWSPWCGLVWLGGLSCVCVCVAAHRAGLGGKDLVDHKERASVVAAVGVAELLVA